MNSLHVSLFSILLHVPVPNFPTLKTPSTISCPLFRWDLYFTAKYKINILKLYVAILAPRSFSSLFKVLTKYRANEIKFPRLRQKYMALKTCPLREVLKCSVAGHFRGYEDRWLVESNHESVLFPEPCCQVTENGNRNLESALSNLTKPPSVIQVDIANYLLPSGHPQRLQTQFPTCQRKETESCRGACGIKKCALPLLA